MTALLEDEGEEKEKEEEEKEEDGFGFVVICKVNYDFQGFPKFDKNLETNILTTIG